MKKTIIGIISILILSLLLTACGMPAESPSNVAESKAQETAGEPQQTPVTGEVQQTIEEEDALNDNAIASQENKKDDVSSLVENQALTGGDSTSHQNQKKENDGITIEQENNSTVENSTDYDHNTTSSPSDDKDKDTGTADIVNPNSTPVFTSETSLRNWFVSEDKNDNFIAEKNIMLSAMSNNNQMIYYRPPVDSDNTMLQLDRIEIWGSTIVYYYRFVDEAYSHLEFKISCYRDNSLEEMFAGHKRRAEQKNDGFSLLNIHNRETVYSENTRSDLAYFIWPQFEGYIHASLKGENHEDKVQDILPYLNLEKVTLRTDTVTE